MTGLQWQSSRVVWVTGCSGRTCGGLQETKLFLERCKKKKKKKNINRVCVEPNVNAFKKENLSTPTKGRKEILYIQKFSYLM